MTEGECDKLHFLDCPDLQSALSDPRHSRIKEHRICGCVFLSCRRDVKFTKRPVTRSCMFLCGVVILAVVLMPHIKCARDASRDTMMSIFFA